MSLFKDNVAEKWVLSPNPANGYSEKDAYQIFTQIEHQSNYIHSYVIWKKEISLNHDFLGDFLIRIPSKDNLVH